ncbi:MAG TPA: ankyrin repeat domain-containing protein [Pseudomonadales bacterium]|nr:ankyrin repeat domain-containing protein [Pseudomonadales bacterium]
MRRAALRRVLSGALTGVLLAATAATAAADLPALIRAVDHAGLARALAAGADPDQRLADGSLPLAWAAEMQDVEAVRLLLAHGAAVNDEAPAANPFRPLLVACLHPHADVLAQLLDAGADVTITGPDRLPVLSVCAAHAPTALVRRMIEAGAPVNARDARGQTPLMWAAANARVETFALLLASGAAIDERSDGGFTPLLFAVKSGSAAMADAALAAGGDPDLRLPDGTSAVQLAMYQGNHGFAARLVERGVDVHAYDHNGRQLLHAAVLADQPRLVRLLLAAGADLDALTGAPTVEWKYESNFRAGAYEWPPTPALMLAAEAGLADTMRLLAEAGADSAWRSATGDNIVLAAAGSGVPEALEVALALAPDADVSNERGETPLHRVLARATGPALDAMLATLARHGARTDLENGRGETAAQIAAKTHFAGRATFAAHFDSLSETLSDTLSETLSDTPDSDEPEDPTDAPAQPAT